MTSLCIMDTQENSLKLPTPRPADTVSNTNGMQEIVTGVYLGCYKAVESSDLVDAGIRYAVCVRNQQDPHYLQPQNPTLTYLTLDIADRETENILRFFPYVNRFIDKALTKNSKVLVYGSSGNSRSATLVSAYLMQKFGLSDSDALRCVKSVRATVAPNAGFKAQLFEYEPIYKAICKVEKEGSSSSYNQRSKRKFDQCIDAGECTFSQLF